VNKKLGPLETHRIETMIVTIRGRKVILDADLARVYGILAKRLNERVCRNSNRFPPDFALLLTDQEVTNLRPQIVTSSLGSDRSQFVTGSHRQP